MVTAELLRKKDAARKAEAVALRNDLQIPAVKNKRRRKRCEADDCLWLKTYCPTVFYNPFTPYQLRLIEDCGNALRYGTQRCRAAPRGGGKSSLVKYLILKYALCRQVQFPLIVAATSTKAKDTLGDIKKRLSAKANSPISEDYPLECHAARYVHPWPSRQRNVTANGRRSIAVEWGAEAIILPTWEDEEPLGPIIMALGITSDELQGCNIYDRRPDFVMLDDLDSRDSLASVDGLMASKIEETIDKTIAGLGGQSKRLGKFMLCTITGRNSAAFKYSDPLIKQWAGERVPAIVEWPDNAERWREYMEMRQYGTKTFMNDKPVDEFGRGAHAMLLEHFDEMHQGAVLSNPYDFDKSILPDGSQCQVSNLQRCYDYIADHNLDSFLTEHQNDPPADTGLIPSGITPTLILKQVSGYPRGIIPPGCTVLTHACDVGKLKGFHWVVRAWRPDGTRFTIDYGIMSVIGAKYGSEEGLDRALYNAVLRRMEEFNDAGYMFEDGEQLRESISLFDARWKTDTILKAVMACGMGVKPVIGIGKSAGCMNGTFRDVTQNTTHRKKCGTTGAYEELHVGDYGRCWAVHADADRWKAFEHDGWMTAQDKPGCSFLFGERSDRPDRLSADERSHEVYANQICGEIEAEVEHRGFLVRKWIPHGKENDYLDASYMSCVAAAMKGIRVVQSQVVSARPDPGNRPTAREMAARFKGK